MNTGQMITLIAGGFIVLLLLVYGVFSDIINAFGSAMGFYGVIAGVLFCLIIILTLLGVNKRR
jgi:uncharacterized membrane protein (DUF373 family)